MAAVLSDEQISRLEREHPELPMIRAAATESVYLVGGAVRDLLLGRGRSDLDLVVVGDAVALAERIGAEVREHDRFATAKALFDDHEVDIATARTESYAQPGALPEVTPADSVEADLSRRDFTVNAMAIPLDRPELIDPHGGQSDLEAGLLRVLHERSFVDDPTRALRAARYAARFGLALEPETELLLRATDLDTVSTDRRTAELLRLAGEASAPAGFELLAEWGMLEPQTDGLKLAARVDELLAGDDNWLAVAPRDEVLLRAVLGPSGGVGELTGAVISRPSEGVDLAAGRDPVDLVLAAALGADWIGVYLSSWSRVNLEIDGDDLVAAGIPEGPAVGRGLTAARRQKLDGETSGREEELAAAIAAAREEDGNDALE